MRDRQRPRRLNLLLTISLSTMICTHSFAEDLALLSIGPRIGFSQKVPPIEERAKILLPHD